MQDIFNSTRGYSSLSLKDLLEARDQYHFHLMNKDNVVATAIGYYRIRKTDPWPSEADPNAGDKKHDTSERTLANSEVRPYSWPAVLVFVNQWMTDEELFAQDPTSIVPKTLFLEDGRKIPVCVIYAPIQNVVNDEVIEENLNFPRNLIGGGFPLITETQKQRRIASVGCLVSDGHTTYALTNKHVAGQPGTPVFSKLSGADIQIGTTSSISVGRVAFNEVYEGWPSKNTYINMDIGLVEVHDLNQWKTEVYSIGTMGRIADLHTGNFNLNLIGAKVIGYGSVSGRMEGEIQALFYRYKSVGGYEYLSDFLVGPSAEKEFALNHGDSGTVLMYQRQNKEGKVVELMPLGVVWGQHEILRGIDIGVHPYALVNCLSLVLNRLGVDLVRGWNIDQPYTWGKVGHYTVAYMAIEAIDETKFPALKKLMQNNRTIISFRRNQITDDLTRYDGYQIFCPLADVPDIIFKMGGTGVKRGGENPNHYADIDLPRRSDNKTLRNLMEDEATGFTTEIWNEYYEEVGVDTRHKGILPFRVWQIFKAMVEYVQDNDRVGFISAAGILTHYIGDACQTLHSSYMSQGQILNNDGELEMYAKNVHSVYEDKMLNKNYEKMLDGLDVRLPLVNKKTRKINNPRDAGLVCYDLMCETIDAIPPRTILDFYVNQSRTPDDLWSEFGELTIDAIARGCQVQARIWEAAWKLGGGDDKIKSLSRVNKDAVKELYLHHKDDFIPSATIIHIDEFL